MLSSAESALNTLAGEDGGVADSDTDAGSQDPGADAVTSGTGNLIDMLLADEGADAPSGGGSGESQGTGDVLPEPVGSVEEGIGLVLDESTVNLTGSDYF